MTRSQQEAVIRIEVTDEQKKQIRQLTGKEISTLELKLEPLEARLTPRLSAN
jgi:hypothetical protein